MHIDVEREAVWRQRLEGVGVERRGGGLFYGIRNEMK